MKFTINTPVSDLKVVGMRDNQVREVERIEIEVGSEYARVRLKDDGAISFKLDDGCISEISRFGMTRLQHKDVFVIERDNEFKASKISVRGLTIPSVVEGEGATAIRFWSVGAVIGVIGGPDGEISKKEREFFQGKPSVEIGRLKDFTQPFSIPDATHFIKEAMIDGGCISKEIKKAPRGVSYQADISKLSKELAQAEEKNRQFEIELGIVNKTLADVRSSLKCPEGANVVVFAAIVRCLSLGGIHDAEIKRRAAAIEDMIHHKSKGAYSEETMNSLIAIVVNQPFDEEVPF